MNDPRADRQGHAIRDADRLFVRKSRDATHQVLWYLAPLRPTTDERFNRVIRRAARWRIEQANRLFDGLDTYPSDGPARVAQAWSDCVENLNALGRDSIEGEPVLADINDTIDSLESYLLESLVYYKHPWLFHWVPTAWRWLTLHSAGVASFVIVVALCVWLPQLSGLLIEAWPATLVFGSFFFASAYGPALFGTLVAVRDREQRVARWDVAGPTFRAFRYQPRPPPRGIRRYARHDEIVDVLARSIALKFARWIGLALVGVAIAWSGDLLFPARLAPTVFFALALFYGACVLASALDFWVFVYPGPVRFAYLASSAVLIALSNVTWGIYVIVPLFSLSALALRLLAHRADRSGEKIHFNTSRALALASGLVVVLACAVHSQREREAWRDNHRAVAVPRVASEDWPRTDTDDPVVLIVASGGGSRAAVYTALTLEQLHRELPQVACSIESISSVSGGSLANAVYTKRRWYDRVDVCGGRWHEPMEGLVEAVSGDFILPTMDGVFSPDSRGVTLQRAWQAPPVGLGHTTVEDIARKWDHDERHGPLPLLNAADLERHAVVVSPLEARAFTNPQIAASARHQNAYDRIAEPTWVYYRDAIYGIDELLPHRTTRLSEAVRASANFPFGFPLVELRTPHGTPYSPAPERRADAVHSVFLTDGGTLSNSGMWSMFQLMRNHEDALGRRGVVLFIIEASRMPEYAEPGRMTGVADVISDQPPIGQALHRAMLDYLYSRLGQRLQVVQIDLGARELDNVETTWALPKEKIDKLRALFLSAWGDERHGVRAELAEAYTRAQLAARECAANPAECAPAGDARLPLLRPPLD